MIEGKTHTPEELGQSFTSEITEPESPPTLPPKKEKLLTKIKERVSSLWRVKSESIRFVPYRRLKNYEGFIWEVDVKQNSVDSMVRLEVESVKTFADKAYGRKSFTNVVMFKIKVIGVNVDGSSNLEHVSERDGVVVNFGKRFDKHPWNDSSSKTKTYESIEECKADEDGAKVNFSEELMSSRAVEKIIEIEFTPALLERYGKHPLN